jgi:predicted nuclease of predicted toxin-antitoxin system
VKFLVDECVDIQLIESLRAGGHDVLYVADVMTGESDVIPAKAYQEQRIVLIEDKDFGELVFRLRKPAICVILLRFSPGEEAQKVKRLHELLQETKPKTKPWCTPARSSLLTMRKGVFAH